MSGKASVSLDWLEKKLCLILANIPALFKAQNASLLFDLVAVGLYSSQSLEALGLLQQTESGWQLSSIHAGIRWLIPFPERHRSEALSRQTQPTKGIKQSRFHQLQLTELPFLGGKTSFHTM